MRQKVNSSLSVPLLPFGAWFTFLPVITFTASQALVSYSTQEKEKKEAE